MWGIAIRRAHADQRFMQAMSRIFGAVERDMCRLLAAADRIDWGAMSYGGTR